jgi:hypothetical protein
MMTTEFRAASFVLLIVLLAGCRHAPELVKAEAYPACCTEAIPATNRINLEQLKDVPVPEIVQFGGLKYRKSEPAYVGCYKFRYNPMFSLISCNLDASCFL